MMRELCALVAGTAACDDEGGRVPELLALARTHRVHLLVEQRLARLKPRPTNSAYEELRVEARVAALRDDLRVRELLRVVEALEVADCAPVVFKGAALSLTHYQQSWRRPRLDADLLVAPAHRARAASTLATLGYARPPMTAGRYVMHQEMHVRPDPVVGEHVVDLHWRLANPNVLAGLPDHAALRGRAARVVLPDGVVAVASPADALVIACVHRAAHHAGSEELLWLYDIHLVASRLAGEEWPLAVSLARRAGVAGVVRQGLELAAGAFGECTPVSVRDDLASAGQEASTVFLRTGLRPLDRLRADVAALGAAGGTRLIAEHLFPPPSYMREKYGLKSGALLPFAYARRIVGGAAGWFKRTDRGL
jgi:hypothetical protein